MSFCVPQTPKQCPFSSLHAHRVLFCHEKILSFATFNKIKGMNRPVRMSFCSQKGGVGKTVFTILFASYLHYKRGMNVAVLDCDYPQHSLLKLRAREVSKLRSIQTYSNSFKKQMEALKKKPYPVIGSDINVAISDSINLCSDMPGTYDVIFFDFPGTINTPGMLSALAEMDYLFIPIEADRVVLESEIEFAHLMSELYRDLGKSSKLHLYWNRMQRSVKTLLYTSYEKVIEEVGLSVLSERIPMAAAFQKEMEQENDPKMIFRSTLFPFSQAALRGTSVPMETFFNEIITITELKTKNNE